MTRELYIGDRRIADDTGPMVTAEISCNHMGDVSNAILMASAAKECGADAVKLQKRDNATLFTREMSNMPYRNPNSFGPTYGQHREALELTKTEFRAVRDHCRKIGIDFIITPFDIPSADFCETLEPDAFKIASADITNVPLLKHILSFRKPRSTASQWRARPRIILSTGGASSDDVERAYRTVQEHGPAGYPVSQQISFLQCTSAYPVEPYDMNLRVIETLRRRYPHVVIGLSDHQNGIAMALVGYMLGARIIEKHFTLNRAWKGTDQAFSLEPQGLKKLVRDLRRARFALGDGIKRRLPAEEDAMRKLGKSLVAARDLPDGHVVTAQDVAVRSPGGGLPPYRMGEVVGKELLLPLGRDEPFSVDVLAWIADTVAVKEGDR